ncbi:MAG: UpxY family transcription antiterminator [Bacteroidales bacterium]|nr:UpxY family transcription antiterminator [Bacteroidales bacterium]
MEEHWFVAKTRYFRHEIKLRDYLTGRGIEIFLPTVRLHAAPRTPPQRTTEKAVVPNLLFLRTDKERACALVSESKLPMSFLTDCATHRMMVIPDKQMEDFRRVFDLSTDHGGLVGQSLQPGERVRVCKGPLSGVEGYIIELTGRTYVAVSLMGVLWTRTLIPKAYLEKL